MVRMKKYVVAALLAASALPSAGLAQHDHEMAGMDHRAMATKGPLPAESGQAAFAAISEVVAMLEADPTTDWSKVNVDALHDHLVDMDNVTLRARVTNVPVAGGMRFEVAGEREVRDSIRRMVESHAGMADGADGQHVMVADTPEGAAMTVTSDTPAGTARIRALGFYGALTGGVHHQLHHLMMAKGEMHH
jgi:hypothetical protein